jgi:predicted ATPase
MEGDAGIGKSALWGETLRAASSREIRVLSCRTAEFEAELSYSSVADLLEPVAKDVLPFLPEPQRRALEAILLVAEPGPGGFDARAAGAALVTSLDVLVSSGPVLVAVDDAQWLDRASAKP